MPSTHQSITVNRPIGDVWRTIRNFHDLSWAPNVITSVENTGNTDGESVGAKRLLNGVFHETLQEVDADNYRFSYSIDDGPSPVSSQDVSNYTGVVELSCTNEGETLVVWTSSWESSSEDAVDFCHRIYVAFLNDLVGSMG